jgi:hypothetical protein
VGIESYPSLSIGIDRKSNLRYRAKAKRDRAEEFLKSEFRPVRYLRKISFGGSLNLFVTPKGSRYWR